MMLAVSMQTQSEEAQSEPDSAQSDVIDISAIAEKHPVNQKTAVLDLSHFNANNLTLLDVLDISEKAQSDPERLPTLLGLGKNSPRKMRMLVALVWVIARRDNPSLTFEEVSTWRIQIKGEVDKEAMRQQAARDKALVTASQNSGIPLAGDPGQLTVGQMAAITDNRQKRRRARR